MSLSLVTKKIAVSPVTSEKYSCRMSLTIVSPMSPVKFKGALDKGGGGCLYVACRIKKKLALSCVPVARNIWLCPLSVIMNSPVACRIQEIPLVACHLDAQGIQEMALLPFDFRGLHR